LCLNSKKETNPHPDREINDIVQRGKAMNGKISNESIPAALIDQAINMVHQ
jgi:hypothetical protein